LKYIILLLANQIADIFCASDKLISVASKWEYYYLQSKSLHCAQRNKIFVTPKNKLKNLCVYQHFWI